MQRLTLWLAPFLAPLLLVACGGEESSPPLALAGPALIMFYTDN